MNSRIVIFALLAFVGLTLGGLFALNPEGFCEGDYQIVTVPAMSFPTTGSTFKIKGSLYVTSQCPYWYYQTKWKIDIIPPEGEEGETKHIVDSDWQDGFGEIDIVIGEGPAWKKWAIIATSECRCVYPWCLFHDSCTRSWTIN